MTSPPKRAVPKPQQRLPAIRGLSAIDRMIRPNVHSIIDTLRRLKDGGKELADLITEAGLVLDAHGEGDDVIGELLETERLWKGDMEKHRLAIVVFLERYGVIPIGSAS